MENAVVIKNNTEAVNVIPRQANNDEQLIELWLHGKAPSSQEGYTNDMKRFLEFTGKSLSQITLGDVQQYSDSLGHLKPRSQMRKLASIKSLFTFACKIGYLPFNPAAPVKLPTVKNDLAERIVSEDTIQSIIDNEPKMRNKLMLKLLYYSGVRVSELCSLKWCDVQEGKNGGQITVLGKGGKTRFIALPAPLYQEFVTFGKDSDRDSHVFRSQKGGALHRSQVMRIVQAAAKRIGLSANVSPHWFRHAHASHSLDNNAPIHLVQQTLGHASLNTTSGYVHAKPGESSGMYLN